MNTQEIQSLIENVGGQVLSLDELPQERVEKALYCVHTCPMSIKSGHWLTLAVLPEQNTNTIIYFDPLGFLPLLKPIVEFINRNILGSLECNKNQIQNPFSSFCGNYSVLLIHHLARGEKYSDFLAQFNQSPALNDEKVVKVFNNFVRKTKKSV